MTTNAATGRGPAGSRILLTAVILELTLATAIIHVDLGGTLFTLNGIDYAGLALAYAVAAVAPMRAMRRFAWLPRIGLAAYNAGDDRGLPGLRPVLHARLDHQGHRGGHRLPLGG